MGIIHFTGKFNPFHVGIQPDLWVEADRGITLAGGTDVSAWADFSGHANHLSESTYRPTWVDNVMNGRPVVRFITRCMRFEGAAFPQPVDSTTFVVLDQDGTQADSYRMIVNRDGAAAPALYLKDAHPDIYWGGDRALMTESVGTDPVIVMWQYSTTAGSSQLARTSINGGAVTGTLGAWTATITTWTAIAGYPPSITIGPFRGDIALIVNYPALLTTAQITRFTRAYGQKYGITVA